MMRNKKLTWSGFILRENGLRNRLQTQNICTHTHTHTHTLVLILFACKVASVCWYDRRKVKEQIFFTVHSYLIPEAILIKFLSLWAMKQDCGSPEQLMINVYRVYYGHCYDIKNLPTVSICFSNMCYSKNLRVFPFEQDVICARNILHNMVLNSLSRRC